MDREERTRLLEATRDELMQLMRDAGVDAQPLEIQLKPGGRAPRAVNTLGIAFIHKGHRYSLPIDWLSAPGGPQTENPLVKE